MSLGLNQMTTTAPGLWAMIPTKSSDQAFDQKQAVIVSPQRAGKEITGSIIKIPGSALTKFPSKYRLFPLPISNAPELRNLSKTDL